MKIGMFYPDDESVIFLSRNLLRRFRSMGSIEVVTVAPEIGYVEAIEAEGARHVSIDMQRFISPAADLRYLRDVYRIARREKFDLVINWTSKPNIYGTLAQRLAGVRRVVCAIRGLGAPFVEGGGIRRATLRRLLTGGYRLAFGLSWKVWFTNPNDLAYFADRGLVNRNKLVLTTNGLDLSQYSPESVNQDRVADLRSDLGLTQDHKVVIMVARLLWPKGVREYAQAARVLRERIPEAVFLLVGPLEEGRVEGVPDLYLREEQAASNLRWLGFRKDVRELYALSDLAVLPSYYKEGGYPRALLEPMSLAKPVIACDTPDCRSPVDVDKNGLLVPPRDAGALAEAIETILGNEELSRSFGAWSLHRVRTEFDDRLVFEKLLSELDSVFPQRSKARVGR